MRNFMIKVFNPKNILTLAGILTLTVFMAVSCSDDTSTGPVVDPIPAQIVKNLETVGVGRGGIGAGDYTLYSLTKDKVVTDSTSKKWDIGFSGASIIVNNTASGPGQAGAVVLDIPFNEINKAPANSACKTDTDTTHAVTWPEWAKYTGRGIPKRAVIPKDNVTIVVKTADGEHFAKIKIINWYKGNPKPEELNPNPYKREDGYYTFKYTISKSGSRNFK